MRGFVDRRFQPGNAPHIEGYPQVSVDDELGVEAPAFDNFHMPKKSS